MRFVVDLKMCQNSGQCTYLAEGIFRLDEDGRLAFRAKAEGSEYVSGEISEQDREAVEEAIQMCPMFAISRLTDETRIPGPRGHPPLNTGERS
jgi:ferredoxin